MRTGAVIAGIVSVPTHPESVCIGESLRPNTEMLIVIRGKHPPKDLL